MLLFFSLRILPHLQDTGGFFVAVLEKHDWLPWQLEAASSKKKSQTEQPPQTITKEEILNEEEETENVPVSVVTQSKRPDDILGRYSTFTDFNKGLNSVLCREVVYIVSSSWRVLYWRFH